MRLLSWQPIGKGALVGKAKILLPIGLEIDGVALFHREDGARWARFPSEVMRDADGQPIKDERGKLKYRTPIRWQSRELQEGFSRALLALVETSVEPVTEPRHQPLPRRRTYPRRRISEQPDIGAGRPFDDDISDVGVTR